MTLKLRANSPRPLTFLAGERLAKAVGTLAIDFLLLLVSVPHYLQYVLCHLRPRQIMMLFYRCHDKFEHHHLNWTDHLPGFYHVVEHNFLLHSTENIFSTAPWVAANVFDRIARMRLGRDSPHPKRLDSNNRDDSVLTANMYLRLNTWASYLYEKYSIELPITQRWVLTDFDITVDDEVGQIPATKLRKLLLMPQQKMTGVRRRRLDGTMENERQHEVVSHAVGFYEIGANIMHVHNVEIEKEDFIRNVDQCGQNLNRILTHMENEHCQFLFWLNLARYIDTMSLSILDKDAANEDLHLEKYDAATFINFFYRKLYHLVWLYDLEKFEKLESNHRHNKMGHYVLFNACKYGDLDDYNEVLDEIQNRPAELPIVIPSFKDYGIKTRMDHFLNRFYGYLYMMKDCITRVPCTNLFDLNFYKQQQANEFELALLRYCQKNKLLTQAGIPKQDKYHQFQRPITTDNENVNGPDLKCCPHQMQDILFSENQIFGSDVPLCYLLAALNLNLMGRHHIGLIYATDVVYGITATLKRSRHDHHKVAICQAWVVLASSLNKCFGAPLRQAWRCAIGYAHVTDFDVLVQLVQEFCLTMGCHNLEMEFFQTIYQPKMVILNSAATFATMIHHLENLFYQLENIMVLMLIRATYKNLVDITCCGTAHSLEKEAYMLQNKIRMVLNYNLLHLHENSDNKRCKLFHSFYSLKLAIFSTNSLANLDRIQSEGFFYPSHFTMLRRWNTRAGDLCQKLATDYSSKIKVEADLIRDYLEYPYAFFNDTGYFIQVMERVRTKTKLVHSVELGNVQFLIGFLHLNSIYSNKINLYDRRYHNGFFTMALENYEVASTCVSDAKFELHRLGIARKLAQVEKIVIKKVEEYNRQQEQLFNDGLFGADGALANEDGALANGDGALANGDGANNGNEEEEQQITISFRNILLPKKSDEDFIRTCFQDLQKLVEVKNNSQDFYYNQAQANREATAQYHANQQHTEASRTIDAIFKSEAFLNACFDVKYNH